MARKLLGYQIADQFGENIQGEENDPSGFPSFHVMSAEEANAVLEKHDQNLLLMPIYEGDIEEPTFS